MKITCRISITRGLALVLLPVLLACALPAANPGLRPFAAGSFPGLVAARADRPFLLVLWSVTCVPCRQEFEMLADLRKSNPGMPLVLVSTDDVADEAVATRILEKYGLEREESWIFAGDAQRLRYEIDPAWYGEMPRAYFYDASHQREAVSGSLDRARVEAWIRREQPEAAPDPT